MQCRLVGVDKIILGQFGIIGRMDPKQLRVWARDTQTQYQMAVE